MWRTRAPRVRRKQTHGSAARGPDDPPRVETTVATELEYRPGDPVRVRVIRRGRRTSIDDDGGAVERAGRPAGWRDAAQKLERELGVNISRSGSISLPVVAVGPPEQEVVERIGQASLAFYQELLDLM